MKYIDAEKLKVEIEKRTKSIESCPFIEAEFGAEMRREGKTQTYNEILSIIDSLQQELPEVDLDGEIKKMLNSDYYKRHIKPSPYVIDVINYTARHFYELGLNARKV